MPRPLIRTLVLTTTFALSALPVAAQRPQARQPRGSSSSADLSDSALVATLSVRSIGPAVMSGRIEDIAVASSPGSRGGELGTVFYVGSASGGAAPPSPHAGPHHHPALTAPSRPPPNAPKPAKPAAAPRARPTSPTPPSWPPSPSAPSAPP